MGDTTTLDRQLGDVVWLLVGGLRSAYNLEQCFEAIAADAPEPAANVFRQLLDNLASGQTMEEAWEGVRAEWPSPHIERIIERLQEHRQAGGNLAVMLAPLGQEIREQAGSDEAVYPAMRKQAYALGRPLPDYARPKMNRDAPPPLPDAEDTAVYDEDGALLATADYLYRQARVFVLTAGSSRWQTWLQAGPARQRLHELGYRTLVVRQDLAQAGIQEVAAYVQEAYPDI